MSAAFTEVPLPKEKPLFIDLAPLIANGLKPEMPSVARLSETYLLYAGRLNEIHAEPSAGKTNIAIICAITVMEDGGQVLYIDPEDTATGVLRRLASLGADLNMVLERFHYLHNPTPEEFERAFQWAKDNKLRLAVLDGLAEGLAAEQKDENSVNDVLAFFRFRLRPFAEEGAAVLIADHVTKAIEGRGRWARGSGAKLSRYDGVSYQAELVEAYSPKRAGKVRLRISKDRNGGVGSCGQIVGTISFTPNGKGITNYEFEEHLEGQQFKPTAIMEKIVNHLKIFPDAGKNDLRSLGNHEWVDKAIECLVSDRELAVSKKGQRMSFVLLNGSTEEVE